MGSLFCHMLKRKRMRFATGESARALSAELGLADSQANGSQNSRLRWVTIFIAPELSSSFDETREPSSVSSESFQLRITPLLALTSMRNAQRGFCPSGGHDSRLATSSKAESGNPPAKS